ncbi:MAG: ABC transporter ATP-binding protein [Victivallaceae bacterium]
MSLLRFENVSFGYPGEGLLLNDFDLSFAPGEFVGVIGPNGSGKSTLLHLGCGYLKPRTGRILLDGRPVGAYSGRERAARLAVLPQLIRTDLPFTVEEIVRLGRIAHRGIFDLWRPEDSAAVERALDTVGLAAKRKRRYEALSGGEKQRAMLAAALAQEPKILLLDEPTSALDLGHKLELMKRLRELAGTCGITVAAISHDLELLGRYAVRLVLLKEGRILKDGPPAEVVDPVWIEKAYDCRVEVMRGKNGEPLLSF